MAHIHVIGAGLAGLAAAVRCTAAGHRVSLYEAAGRAGGRCRSFHDETLGCVIDNGNHLLLSGNRSARAYLAEVGAQDRLAGPPATGFPFVDLESGERWQVSPGDSPWPGWVFDPARRVAGSRAGDYLSALRLLAAPAARPLDRVLDSGSALYRRFWEPLAVAALNTPPDRAAAGLLRPVLLETFARGGAACRPLIARDSLADSFVDPALAHLGAAGAAVHFHARVGGLARHGGRVAAMDLPQKTVSVSDGDAVVLAVPPWTARQLLPELPTPPDGEAIVNVHYRLPAAPFADPVRIVGLIGGLAQWVFVRGAVASVTISAADAVARRSAADIAQSCWGEVVQALQLGPAELPPHRVIKEKRATFDASADALGLRPGPATAYVNLALAGDWTGTGLPATIESAVRSGHRAAALLMRRLPRTATAAVRVAAAATRQETGGVKP